MKGNLILAVIVSYLILASASASEINITAKTAANLPIANITVSFYNDTTLLYENTTDVQGYLDSGILAGSTIAVTITMPSSAYSARIDSINGSGKVFLGDVYGTTLRLVNTLGQPLEAQDCAVAIYRNDTGDLIKAYDTTCRQGEKYIDPTTGNWAAITACPLTDSNGWYYFTTRIQEADGYQYNLNYSTRITCNARTASTNFQVDVQRPPDVDMWLSLFVNYGGAIILAIVVVALGLVTLGAILALTIWILRKARKG